ncbi:MAG: DUF4349 domain-containing protein [Novosphingobium sp.]|nr:DUF4349 domain-containing protein [Novosphingobium sp.]
MRLPRTALIAFIAPALLLSACSAEKAEDGAPATSEAASGNAAASAPDAAGPGIGGAVARGVAFTYAYAFTLPAKSVSTVQREHAAACERLGVARCRVTGMSFEQPGSEDVSARLDLLLAPDLAHRFASEGIAAVERAKGKLDHASVNGENAGDAIKVSQADSAAIQAEVERLQARLAAKGLTGAERVELQQQVAGLTEQLRGQAADRKANEASIASTPVSFSYASEGLLMGGNTFAKAAGASLNSMEAALALVTLAAGVALPWMLLIALIVLAWRGLRRRSVAAVAPAEPTSLS